MEEYSLVTEKLKQEKKFVVDELLTTKEKLISLEALNEKLLAKQVRYPNLKAFLILILLFSDYFICFIYYTHNVLWFLLEVRK